MTPLLANPVDAMSLTPAPQATSAAELAKRGQIHATAQKFESSFLTTVFQTMFQDINTDSEFSGGPGEDMWKSFLGEAMAGAMVKRGGIGIAQSVEREMLKMQGLSETPAAVAPATNAQAFAASLKQVGASTPKPVLQ